MATTCEDDVAENMFIFNKYQVEVTPESSFTMQDTIWIHGKVSSNVFDAAVNDSVFISTPEPDYFSIYKFITPTQDANCKDAIDAFELVVDTGQFMFLPSCENGKIEAHPDLESNNASYSYRIGLKPSSSGDFVISLREGILENSNRNEFIIAEYPLEHHPNSIGFDSCGEVSWRDLDSSEKEYYFTVE
ncbi:hypothetical protein [Oceanihabitans sediminis]|uniref:Uncharacterized protein n=2 Tax=Oceanihabitans sediminis TaxID=1812012 RepID=A0A368P1C2_9FLAO|nr:hypothetical protein [Oceanihabitans sediminis]MDX1279082.1 hypothetical protein [Oceanihabitans sediminis]MDX1774659.1 hypothetical protein [Oceanihabitans sediminis]RCU56657.1 hypothetical protein DU428_12250 [Oceanihabitans sediminis]